MPFIGIRRINIKCKPTKFIVMKSANPILIILSILLPIIGYVLFFVKKDDEPTAANQYLWSAIGGSVVGLLLML